MKDHEVRELVNSLTEVAKVYGQMEQLRERIAHIVIPVMTKEDAWKKAVLTAMKQYGMEISLYENEPDNAVCDLLFIHGNAMAQEAIQELVKRVDKDATGKG